MTTGSVTHKGTSADNATCPHPGPLPEGEGEELSRLFAAPSIFGGETAADSLVSFSSPEDRGRLGGNVIKLGKGEAVYWEGEAPAEPK